MNIRILTEVLSDNSKVYNVRVGDRVFPAVTKKDAYAFADKIVAAIEEHTTEVAQVVE